MIKDEIEKINNLNKYTKYNAVEFTMHFFLFQLYLIVPS